MIIGISGKIGSGKDTVGLIIQYLLDHRCDNPAEYSFDEWLNRSYEKYSNWKVKKFAGKLKQIVSLLTGCKVEDLEDQDFKNKYLPDEWNWWVYRQDVMGRVNVRMTPKFESQEAAINEPKDFRGYQGEGMGSYNYRHFLQAIGTDAMREIIHRNVWVNALFADYKEIHRVGNNGDYYEYPNWIITDMRFPNEMKAVKDRGGITVRIQRDWQFVHGVKVMMRDPLVEHYKTPHASETALDDAPFDFVIYNDGTIEDLIKNVELFLRATKIIN